MKQIIFELGIDDIKKEFTLIDNFKDFPLSEMNGIIGILTTLTHNYMHIQGTKQIEYNDKVAKQN